MLDAGERPVLALHTVPHGEPVHARHDFINGPRGDVDTRLPRKQGHSLDDLIRADPKVPADSLSIVDPREGVSEGFSLRNGHSEGGEARDEGEHGGAGEHDAGGVRGVDGARGAEVVVMRGVRALVGDAVPLLAVVQERVRRLGMQPLVLRGLGVDIGEVGERQQRQGEEREKGAARELRRRRAARRRMVPRPRRMDCVGGELRQGGGRYEDCRHGCGGDGR